MAAEMAGVKRNAKGQLQERPKGSGRIKGQPNKAPAKIRGMICEALDRAGGVKYLLKQAHAEPRAFLALIRATMPKEVIADVGSSLESLLARSFEQPAATKVAQKALKAAIDGASDPDDELEQELRPEEDEIRDVEAVEKAPVSPQTPTSTGEIG